MSAEIADRIPRPRISISSNGSLSGQGEHILERVLREVYEEGAEKAMALNAEDLKLAEAFRIDPTIKRFVVISDHLITTTAKLTQDMGIFRKVSYSFEIQSSVKPKREIQTEKY